MPPNSGPQQAAWLADLAIQRNYLLAAAILSAATAASSFAPVSITETFVIIDGRLPQSSLAG